jgi:antitoxin component of RelBE/YafQ-DinJ toxin-antitoxin module
MTVQIEVDEKMWAEAEKIAKELNINYSEMFLNTLRSDLYRLKEAKHKELTITEKERKHRESYEKFPQTDEEINEWEEVQYWEDE